MALSVLVCKHAPLDERGRGDRRDLGLPPRPVPFQLWSDGPLKESVRRTETALEGLRTDGDPTDPPPRTSCSTGGAGEDGGISASLPTLSPLQLGPDRPPKGPAV